MIIVYDYDTEEFPFASEIEVRFKRKFGGFSLTELHRCRDYSLRVRENDWKTEYHTYFYQLAREAWFRGLYRNLMIKVVMPQFSLEKWIAFQAIPTFRVQLPDNKAVGEFHRDIDYNHPKTEQNFWLPLTEARESSMIWVESEYNKGDYAPAVPLMQPGQILQFDGARLRHGNMLNKTGKTRVSFDFRIVPASSYEASERKTLNSGMQFVLGDYYERLNKF